MMIFMQLPDPIQKIADQLAELPSIGPRQAIRLAFYLAARSKEDIRSLALGIDQLRNLKICERCFFFYTDPLTPHASPLMPHLCDVCRNPNRNQRLVMIVEKETDYVSIENTKKFTGRYLIVGPISKTGLLEAWQKMRLQSFKGETAKQPGGQVDEIILGFNPTALGDLQASLLAKELAPLAKKISRLGRGLPTGGEIEFADDETLGSALQGRL